MSLQLVGNYNVNALALDLVAQSESNILFNSTTRENVALPLVPAIIDETPTQITIIGASQVNHTTLTTLADTHKII